MNVSVWNWVYSLLVYTNFFSSIVKQAISANVIKSLKLIPGTNLN